VLEALDQGLGVLDADRSARPVGRARRQGLRAAASRLPLRRPGVPILL